MKSATLFASALVAASAILGSGCAQQPTTQAGIDDAARSLTSIRRLDPDAHAMLDDRDGYLLAMGRLGTLQESADPREYLARTSLPRTLQPAGYDLRSSRDVTSAAGWRHVRFSQEYRGLTVWGRQLSLHIDPAGQVAAINGQFMPATALPDPRAALSAEEAVAIALRVAKDEPGSALYPLLVEPQLVIVENGRVYRSAWTLVLPGTDADDRYAEWRFFIDALTGAVLRRNNDVRYMAAIGQGLDCDLQSRDLNVFETDDAFIMRDVTRTDRGGAEIHTRVAGGDFATDPDAEWIETEIPVRDSQQAEVSLHYWLGKSYDRLFELTGREGWDNQGLRIEAFAHQPGMNNAYWTPNSARLAFGTGDGPRYRAFACANDIVAHEFMHGVVHYTAGLGDDRDADAMNESFADMLAVMVDSADWIMGEGASQSGNSGFRHLADPAAGGDPDHYSDIGGGEHRSSLISSHAFYLAAEGLRHNSDSGYECDTSLGRDVAFGHFYYALDSFLQPKSTMPQLAVYVTYIAENILGHGREERADVFAEAFRRVGLGDGGRELACAEPWVWGLM